MKILVVGSGGREHAIAWAFARSKRTSGLFVAPGNAGTADIATNMPSLDPTDSEAVIRTCREHKIDLVFVGPEAPLAAGLVDRLGKVGIASIGPHKAAAELESSKAFAKDFMRRYGVPTAHSREFTDFHAFKKHIDGLSGKVVVKKSGLAAGKGVLESSDRQEIVAFAQRVLRDDAVVVEDFLVGYEVSIFAVYDGEDFVLLPPCADYKKAHEGATGPNTGGLGSVCPVPWLEPSMFERIRLEVVEPTFRGLRESGLGYKGILYFGLMITEAGPNVLEYNVRFGDPETQVLLPLIRSDFGDLCSAVAEGKISSFPLSISEKSAVGVVVAAPGYPGDYPRNIEVTPLAANTEPDRLVFHASTYRDKRGTLRTNGGRCFTAVGLGNELLQARITAYSVAQNVQFNGAWFRSDIGGRIFGN